MLNQTACKTDALIYDDFNSVFGEKKIELGQAKKSKALFLLSQVYMNLPSIDSQETRISAFVNNLVLLLARVIQRVALEKS